MATCGQSGCYSLSSDDFNQNNIEGGTVIVPSLTIGCALDSMHDSSTLTFEVRLFRKTAWWDWYQVHTGQHIYENNLQIGIQVVPFSKLPSIEPLVFPVEKDGLIKVAGEIEE